ncbi:hypothetical protein W97_05803 [Coniosporium apollinis CBS 100218]|uniref:Uncharacterized protein n=1 Tax=Coniosporium apollinis (strain CBS 100218) TaxID=1168221 RepID=R7YXH8_CONA1|nr:uncharacterized protein W97_05803 [Coniosporium apollinis CBS 100218]EON66558.1 hypothetical protein W97_05803 [Coniosporium apollinis CBS 100218]
MSGSLEGSRRLRWMEVQHLRPWLPPVLLPGLRTELSMAEALMTAVAAGTVDRLDLLPGASQGPTAQPGEDAQAASKQSRQSTAKHESMPTEYSPVLRRDAAPYAITTDALCLLPLGPTVTALLTRFSPYIHLESSAPPIAEPRQKL